MYRHVVLFAFRDEVTDAQKQGVLEGLARLPREIDVVRAFTFGPDAGGRADNHDIAVVADFDSAQDYAIYAEHPAHDEFRAGLRPLLTSRAAAQFEV